MSIAKQIILDELREQSHLEPVEDTIFCALEYYAKSKYKGCVYQSTAYLIKERIIKAKNKQSENK